MASNDSTMPQGQPAKVDDSSSSPAPQSNQPAETANTGVSDCNKKIVFKHFQKQVALEHRKILRLHGLRTEAASEDITDLVDLVKARPLFECVRNPALVFEPFYFFFYGSLQDPEVLVSVCELSDPNPTLKHGTIKDWRAMMWGPYPALVPQEDSEVKGMYWKCEKPIHVDYLRRYESSAYRMEFCTITTDDGEVIENGRVFVAQDLDDLVEGTFDLKAFMRRN
ncbi:hypothetical protein F4677DRAFT_445085 [Hypoxylon crocopeplum]|nr:hypothetical protein F4677DRAFT_445085 [Hypoxylon crocopeplum]